MRFATDENFNGEAINQLQVIIGAGEAADFHNKIIYIPLR